MDNAVTLGSATENKSNFALFSLGMKNALNTNVTATPIKCDLVMPLPILLEARAKSDKVIAPEIENPDN